MQDEVFPLNSGLKYVRP